MNNIKEYIQEKLVINKNVKFQPNNRDQTFSFNEFKEELINITKVNKHECATIINNFDTDIDIKKMSNYHYKLLNENNSEYDELFKRANELQKKTINFIVT